MGAIILTAVALALAAPPFACAHDFWIEPSSFHPAPGSIVDLSLRVGEGFAGEPVERSSGTIERFVLLGPEGSHSVGGPEGGDPAGRARPQRAGVHVVAFQSRPFPIELEAAKFESYLRHEGLDAVIAARAAREQRLAPGRELFSRCAKALLDVRPSEAPDVDRSASRSLSTDPLGLTLEIVAESDPIAGPRDQPVGFRLLYDGRPLAGALISALDRERPALVRSARTAEDGRVAFVLPGRGPWLVRAVHMVAGPPGSGFDWESFWASLTFERR